MGQYDNQYRSYYNNYLANHGDKRAQLNTKTYANDKNENKILKKLMNQIIGTLVITLFVLSMKVIPTDFTHNAYKYGKEVIKQDFDYKYYVKKAKEFNFKQTVDYINNVDVSKYFDIDTFKNTFDFEFDKYFLFLDYQEFEGI